MSQDPQEVQKNLEQQACLILVIFCSSIHRCEAVIWDHNALLAARAARSKGWVANEEEAFCPEHANEVE